MTRPAGCPDPACEPCRRPPAAPYVERPREPLDREAWERSRAAGDARKAAGERHARLQRKATGIAYACDRGEITPAERDRQLAALAPKIAAARRAAGTTPAPVALPPEGDRRLAAALFGAPSRERPTPEGSA